MLTPQEIADKIWEAPDTAIIELESMIATIIRNNNQEKLSELQIGETAEKLLLIVIRFLEDKISNAIQNDINPKFNFSEISKYRIIGSANIGNRALLTQLTGDIVSLIGEVNAIRASKGLSSIFEVTDTSFKCQPVLQKPTKTKTDFSEYIDALYFLVYEASSATHNIPKAGMNEFLDQNNNAEFKENFIIKEINNLRLSFRHDIDQWNEAKRLELIKNVSAICKSYAGKDSIAQFQPADYLKIQEDSLKNLKQFLLKLKAAL